MEASKITLSDKYKSAMQNPTLSRNKRLKLKRQLILELIRSKPSGTPIKLSEISRLITAPGNVIRDSNADRVIKNMVRDGLITAERIPGKSQRIFSVISDAKTILPPRPKAPKIVLPPVGTPAQDDHTRGLRGPGEDRGGAALLTEATALAKDFAWKYNSDSLRDFIKYLGDK